MAVVAIGQLLSRRHPVAEVAGHVILVADGGAIGGAERHQLCPLINEQGAGELAEITQCVQLAIDGRAFRGGPSCQ